MGMAVSGLFACGISLLKGMKIFRPTKEANGIWRIKTNVIRRALHYF